jgi:hypothetical protein
MSDEKKALVISAFACCGKTCATTKLNALVKNVDYFKDRLNVIDIGTNNTNIISESYSKQVAEEVKEKLSSAQIIFVPSCRNIRRALDDAGIKYILIFPEPSELNEWVGRAYIRGDSPDSINSMINSWSSDLRDCLLHDNRLNVMLRGSSIGSVSKTSTIMRWLVMDETVQYIDGCVKNGLLPEGTFCTEISIMRAEGWRLF